MSEIPADKVNLAPRVANPCPECPFNRKTTRGNLGGSPTETYVGQIYGPFVLACHMHIDFRDPGWSELTKYSATPQCAGAAVMRANIGADQIMPAAMPRAARNTQTVFADMAEFVAYHDQITVQAARLLLSGDRIPKLVRDQVLRAREGRKP